MIWYAALGVVLVLGLVALHLRSKNEEMRADYRLRSQSKSEIEDVERQLEELRRQLADAHTHIHERIQKLGELASEVDRKMRSDFEENDQKLQHRIAAAEQILVTRQNMR